MQPILIGTQIKTDGHSASTPTKAEAELNKNPIQRLSFVKCNVLVDSCASIIANHISNLNFSIVDDHNDWQAVYWKHWYNRYGARFISKLVKKLVLDGRAYGDPIVQLDWENHYYIKKINLLRFEDISKDFAGNTLLGYKIQKTDNWFYCEYDDVSPGLKLFENVANLSDNIRVQTLAGMSGRIGNLFIMDNPSSAYKPDRTKIVECIDNWGKSYGNANYLPGCSVLVDRPGSSSSDLNDSINNNTYLILSQFHMQWTAQAIFGSMGTGTYISYIKDSYNQDLATIADVVCEALDEMAMKMAMWNGEISTVEWTVGDIKEVNTLTTLQALQILTGIKATGMLNPATEKALMEELGLPTVNVEETILDQSKTQEAEDYKDAASASSIQDWLDDKKMQVKSKLIANISSGRDPKEIRVELSGASKLAQSLALNQSQFASLKLAVDSFNSSLRDIIHDFYNDVKKASEEFEIIWERLIKQTNEISGIGGTDNQLKNTQGVKDA